MGIYVNTDIPIAVQCGKGHIWSPEPPFITSRDHWCIVCAGYCPIAAEAKYRKKVAENGGKVLGVYVNVNAAVELECERGHRWSPQPHSITSMQSWCPKCRATHGERLLTWLHGELMLPYAEQVPCPAMPKYKYDGHTFYNKRHSIVEFDGMQHHDRNHYHNTHSSSGFETLQRRDALKTAYAMHAGIQVIRLSEHVLKCDRDQVKTLYVQALQLPNLLLYIDAIDGEPFLSANAPLYDWLTTAVTTLLTSL